MAFKSRSLEKKTALDLRNFYSKNKDDLRKLILYLNDLDTGWRKYSSMFFKTLKELEKELEKKGG